MLRPPTFRKGQVLAASDLNAMSLAVSSVTGQPLNLAYERGRVSHQSPVPRGLLGGAAMVTKFDPQNNGTCIAEGVFAVNPTTGVSAAPAACWCCGGVCLVEANGSCFEILSIHLPLDKFGRAQCKPVWCKEDKGRPCRLAAWSFECGRAGSLHLPIARRVRNCVVTLSNEECLQPYAFSMRNLSHVSLPILPQNAPHNSPGINRDCLDRQFGPVAVQSVPLLSPLPCSNTIATRRIGAGGGVCVRLLGALCRPDGTESPGAIVGLSSGIQFSNLSRMGEGYENWYKSCKAECLQCCLGAPLSPSLHNWQNLAQFRLRLPVVCAEYSSDGRVCNFKVVKKAKIISLQAYQEFPHIIQFRFSPQNYDYGGS